MKLLSRLFDFIGVNSSNTESLAKTDIPANVLNEALERVVDGTDPNMRYFPGYKKILNNSVATSLAYISNLVDTIPGPIFISSKTFISDPQIKAYFAAIADIQNIFSGSTELRDFFEVPENCNLREACALLCMNETGQSYRYGKTTRNPGTNSQRKNRFAATDPASKDHFIGIWWDAQYANPRAGWFESSASRFVATPMGGFMASTHFD